ncbi:MAG: putative spermidine/putrescine transport system ATP-binding protein [Thermoplasmata archaeon]|nr:putative spermidine/putrescine transport system ATP-binding protein [Thermoplasmata archaeon]
MSLRVDGLSFTFPGWPPTLRQLTLEVPAGRSGFLLGPSGAGKSTLLRCIAGLEHGYEGRVLLDGQALEPLPPHRRGIGLMLQETALFPHLTVAGNVAFGLPYRGVPRRQRRQEALHWLGLVGLAERADAAVDELSGGQRSRVALARTLAARPKAVLLDEPLSGLDAVLRLDLGTRLKALLAAQGVPALWVTHDETEARRLADVAWRLVDGQALPERSASR